MACPIMPTPWPSPVIPEPMPPDGAPAVASIGGVQPYPTLNDAALDRLPDPVPLVDGMLWRDTLAVIFGKWGSYKTFFALAIAFAVALGRPVFGRRVMQGDVLYLFGEGLGGMKKRVRALKRLHGVDTVPDIHFLPHAPHLNVTEDMRRLVATVNGMPRKPVLIVVDTLARHYHGAENSQEDMSPFVAACDELRRVSDGAHVLIVHHAGWDGSHSRGSSALPAALDTEVMLSRDGGTERVTVSCTKSRDAEPFPPMTLAFRPVIGTGSGTLVPADAAESDRDRVLDAIRRLQPVSLRALRTDMRAGGRSMSNDRIDRAIDDLRDDGCIARDGTGLRIAERANALSLGIVDGDAVQVPF